MKKERKFDQMSEEEKQRKLRKTYGISALGLVLCGITGVFLEYVLFRTLGVVTALVSPFKMIGIWFVFSLIVAAIVLLTKRIMRKRMMKNSESVE